MVWERDCCDMGMRLEMRPAYNAGDAKVVSLHLGHLHRRAADVPHSDTGKMTTLERRENVTVINTNTVSYLYHSNAHLS